MPEYQPYINGSVAYKREAYERDDWAPVERREPKRRVDVIPGGAKGRANQLSPAQSIAMRIAKVTIAAVVVFAGLGVARVSMSAATVAEALQAREVTKQLSDARSSINKLEVMQSSLSNPSRIKAEAAARGMDSAAESIVLDLSGDIVATDAAGSLSLSGSMAMMMDNLSAARAAEEMARLEAEAAAAAEAAKAAADEALAATRAA